MTTSNLGKLFGLVAASKAINYWNIPTTTMGLAQTAMEEVWMLFVGGNVTEKVQQYATLATSTLGSTRWVGESTVVPWGLLCSWHWLIITFLAFLIYLIFWKGVLRDNYYSCSLMHYYYKRILKMHRSTIIDVNDQLLLVNKHLMKLDLFIGDYGHYKYFQNEYDGLPQLNTTNDIKRYKDLYIPSLSRCYYFNDPERNARGYIRWHSKEISVSVRVSKIANYQPGSGMTGLQQYSEDTAMKTRIPILELVINQPVSEYIKDLRLKDEQGTHQIQRLFCYVTSGKSKHGEGTRNYSRLISQYDVVGGNEAMYFREHYAEEMEKTWIDTFFHPCKLEIWPKLKAINFEPERIHCLGQYAQASYCLYGPPGTGKSTFVYRAARALGRGIISINLASIDSVYVLRDILGGCHVICGNKTIATDPTRVIFVFDEFDKALLAIKARSELKLKREQEQYARVETLCEMLQSKRLISRVALGRSTSQVPTNTPTEKEENRGEDKGETLESTLDETVDHNDQLTVDSLLDIIQGACEIPGLITFATTNCYEDVRSMCPRLFRDGRFKPLYFGYPTRAVVSQITEFYTGHSVMGTEYDFIPEQVRIPTARLTTRMVDLQLCCNGKEQQFTKFIEHLRYDLDNYKLSETYKQYEGCIDSDLTSNGSGDTDGNSNDAT